MVKIAQTELHKGKQSASRQQHCGVCNLCCEGRELQKNLMKSSD